MEQHSVNSKRNLLLLDSVVKNQKNLQNFITQIKECDGCSKEWTVGESFRSWYDGILTYAAIPGNSCNSAYDATEGVITTAGW